jgi:hypothetical protein
MNTNQTWSWIGKSGTQYAYFVYPLPASFKENNDGNYIFCKLADKHWIPIYIGEGDLGERVENTHHQASCIKSKGVTHVHAHLNPSESARKSEESDLLANYPIAYKPYGCNEKEGG